VKLYPAIDILGGKAVRLARGDFDVKKVYDEDPLLAARRWTDAGARQLHVVDLDGAREGRPVNLEHLGGIASLGVPVQYGGGLRSLDAIRAALATGAERVILGTAALTEPDLLGAALEEHGSDRVVVSVDVRAGEVVVDGWTRAADRSIKSVFAELIGQGVRELVYTNVDRDGMLEGPNVDDLTWIAGAAGAPLASGRSESEPKPQGRVICSGGIGTLTDLVQLTSLRVARDLDNLDGVIVGKALYEGRFTIAQAHEALGA
jgi:phosphoribosylformimino-5-aminoimidazole carboxamide ribotide isomerase